MNRRICRRAARAAPPLLIAAVLVGCGRPTYPVEGRVKYADGSPLVGGTVIVETTLDGEPVSAQGSVNADGVFTLGTDRPGGGVPAGKYRVAVVPPPLPDGEAGLGKLPAVDGRFTRPESSGITFEVKPEKNVMAIKVERPVPPPPPPPPESETETGPDDKKPADKKPEEAKPGDKQAEEKKP